jgi:hypothetical protein
LADETFYDVLTEAVRDVSEHGFDGTSRLADWQQRLRDAALRSLRPPIEMERLLRDALTAVYEKLVGRGQVLRLHPGVSRFTLDRLAPRLRLELDRRILASADLIRLNRNQAIESTLRRFAGWTTSVPAGGSKVVDRTKEKVAIRKSLADLPFEERRVLIDQGHKLRASISELVAEANNAIACVWHDHHLQANYDYRPEHKARDGKVFLLRSSWAKERGLVKPGKAGYADDVEKPGEFVFCRCFYTYLYSLGALPPEMLTEKGRKALDEAQSVTRKSWTCQA